MHTFNRITHLSLSTMKHPFFLLFLSLSLLVSCTRQGEEVSLASFLEEGTIEGDATLAFHHALDYCRAHKAKALVIPRGTYNVYPDYAYERYAWVTNNDASLKRILLDLRDMHGFEVRGDSSTIVLHGFMSPMFVDHCSDIKVSGLNIDCERTFHSEGLIKAVGDDYIDVSFPEAYPYRVEGGKIHYYDKQGVEYPSSHMLEFDAVLREPAYRAVDYWTGEEVPVEEPEEGIVRFFVRNIKATVGNIMVMGASNRYCPAFVLAHSEGVTLQDVNIWHAGGMGVVGQFSKDIELQRVHVVPSPGKGRIISITADATHFVHSSGYLRMIDCDFFNQIDDATNIHGIYAIVKRLLPDNRLLVTFGNGAQVGLELLQPDMDVEIVNKDNLIANAEAKVTSVSRFNQECSEVAVEGDLSAVKEGDLIVPSISPEVLIKGCRLGKNRARGFLLGSRKSTTIEDCFFHTSGASILLEGDGYYWYEQAGPRNVTIRNNTFSDCMYGAWTWGSAVIASGAGPRSDRLESAYNRNLLIENNHFILTDPRLLNIYSTDSCVVRNNSIEFSSTYPKDPAHEGKEMFITKDSRRIHIEQ